MEARDQESKDTALLAAARWGHRDVVCLLAFRPPKWAGVSEEVRHLVNVICFMIATTLVPLHWGMPRGWIRPPPPPISSAPSRKIPLG
jgi:hypothetical protein